MSQRVVTIIGGGLAGAEAAWQAANRGAAVRLYEMRPEKMTPAHKTGLLAEFLELEDSGKILETGGGGSPGLGDASRTPGASQGEAPGGLGQSVELGRELARAWMAYLAPGSGEGTVEEEGAVDFFDPWG